MSSRLIEKLKRLGLSAEDSPSSAPKTPVVSKKKMTFRIYFPLPPFDGIHFNALKAGQGAYNFTGQLLGVGGKQLQKIKQESNARVEVVNAYGNLHGLHPDPLDEDLHALITADCLAKLQKAADMVVQVLSPTNAQFETFRVDPGGSARLTVAQPVNSKAGTASKPKHSNRTSLDGSSCSSTVMPPSPALTPVTPAGTGSRHGSVFAPSSSGPNSCCSSRAPTPSPCVSHGCSRGPSESVSEAHDSFGGPRSSCSSGESGSKDTYSHLEDLQLPPAALPAETQLPLAAEEWPALPSSQESISSSVAPTTRSQQPNADTGLSQAARSSSQAGNEAISESSSTGNRGSSSHSSYSCQEHTQRPSSAVPESQIAWHAGAEQQYGEACGSLCHTSFPTATGTAQAAVSAADEPFSAAASARGSNAGVEGWAGSVESTGYTELAPASITVITDPAAEQGSMLSPLTPQQQYQQRQQQGSHHEQQQGSGVRYCTPEAPGSSSSGVFSFGVNWEGSSMGRSSLVASTPATYGTPFELPYTTSQFVQGSDMLSFGLDLDTIRNNSTIVANACLHCDMPSGAGCCGGYAAVPPGMPQDICAGDNLCSKGPTPGFSEAPFAGSSSVAPASNGHGAEYVDQQQQEHHMRMVAEAAASVYRSSDGGGSTVLPRSSCPGDAETCGMPYQPGVNSLGCAGWGLAQYASAQTAAVAAAATSVFGMRGVGTDAADGFAGPSNCWGGGSSSLGALTSSGFLASKSIW